MLSLFRREYLRQLIQRHGEKDCELKVEDVALVGCKNFKRVSWPIDCIQELCRGRDGHVRVVKVKTRNSILTRLVRKLYHLEWSLSRLWIRASGGVLIFLEPAPVSGRYINSFGCWGVNSEVGYNSRVVPQQRGYG
ncbi:DUF5641 domain-containing protein [Trichonephila clavata]|uniref:DUF5641 domain-containing protein n=1 Tax=Trichonephila clavata TaxID=2740835 RepID=A0A8X6LWW5_TRICU|nr:DUF5641 domain-containing protein [Trichonephila clavata]